MIAPRTDEEAPAKLKPWLNQRTRWMKGYLLTQVTLGGSLLSAMAHGPLLIWTAASVAMLSGLETWHVVLFGLGYGSALAAALVSGARHASPLNVLTLPLYWPLQSVAMARALFEMKQRPHHWAKTPHGRYRAPARQEPEEASSPGTAPEDNVVQLPLPF